MIFVYIFITWNTIFLCFQNYYKKKNEKCAKPKDLKRESSLKN